jgi:4-amino-4-deoxy-L-arabinose transferase-like glycosyltransferase
MVGMFSKNKLNPTQMTWLGLLGLAALGVLLGWLATARFGPGVASDGVSYLGVAQNLLDGRGFFTHTGDPLVLWPPLYPILVAGAAALFGVDVYLAAGWINLLCFGLIIFQTGALVRVCLPEQPLYTLLAGLVMTFSISWLRVSANISSDPLFMVLTLSFFLIAAAYVRRPGWGLLAGLGLMTGAASLVRYMGLALLVAGVVVLLAVHGRHWRTFAVRLGVFGLLGAGPLLAWLLGHNLRLYGTLTGSRQFAQMLPAANLQDSYAKITAFFLPYELTDRIPSALFWLAGLAGLLWLNRRLNWVRFGQRLAEPVFLAQLTFGLAYLGFLIFAVNTSDQQYRISDRYQAVLLPTLLCLGFAILHELVLPHIPAARQRLAAWVGLGLFGVWLLYPLLTTFQYVRLARLEGEPTYNLYTTRAYRESGIVEFLSQYPFEAEARIYTNYAAAGWFYTRRLVERSPRDEYQQTADPARLAELSAGWPAVEPAYLVWFKPNDYRNYFDPDQLAEVADLERIYSARDGEVYRVRPKP